MAAARAPLRRAAPARRALAAALLLAAAAASTHAMLSASDAAAWRDYMQESAAVSAGAGQAASALAGVLSHAYNTPLEAVMSSNVYTGGNARLRRLVSDLAAGKPARVVAIGGVATNGSDASERGRTDYLSQYVNYLTRAFPASPLRYVRASAGLAPSAVVAGCLDKYLPADTDLVILEMTANDGAVMDTNVVSAKQPRAYEVLVRKILSSGKKPALILTQTMPRGMGNGTRAFFLTPESPHYAAVSGYYNVPYVSMRNALWPGGRVDAKGLMTTDAVDRKDGSTPEDAGHDAIADSLVFLTQRTAQDLQLLPYGDWDAKSIDLDVPARTMYGGLEDVDKILVNATCTWVVNATVAPGCPSNLAQMCGLDYSSWPAVKASYAVKVTDTFKPSDGDAGGGSKFNEKAAVIGGVVGGVLGGLALLSGLAAWTVTKRQKKRQAEEAAFAARMARSKSPLPLNAPPTVDVTATSGKASHIN